MLKAGQVFRLATDVVAIEPFENRMRAVLIPSGNVVQVTKYPCPADDRMADVLWDGKPVVVFGRDLHERAQEITAMSASQSGRS